MEIHGWKLQEEAGITPLWRELFVPLPSPTAPLAGPLLKPLTLADPLHRPYGLLTFNVQNPEILPEETEFTHSTTGLVLKLYFLNCYVGAAMFPYCCEVCDFPTSSHS